MRHPQHIRGPAAGRATKRRVGAAPTCITLRTVDVASLADGVLSGDRRAVARAISMVEDGADGLAELSARIYPRTGNAYTIGLTGSPGVGKSSLAQHLLKAARDRERTVAVLAIDPTSPFTGG